MKSFEDAEGYGEYRKSSHPIHTGVASSSSIWNPVGWTPCQLPDPCDLLVRRPL